ncbi:hypothetical protein C8029_08655 [Roseobacter sp. TSBP12]|nr:hypothetical protein C8029_08655 [Roseobacter sp. TSBP12]|tara:strand:- start:3157 stop:4104 length:948 start_codon:yes stop_codon:yes gene_type:complete
MNAMTAPCLTYSVRTFFDATEQEAGLPGWEQRYMRTHGGSFEGSVAQVSLGPVTISEERSSIGMLQWSAPPPGKIIIAFVASNQKLGFNGMAVADCLMLQRGGSEILCHSNASLPERGMMIEVDETAVDLPPGLFRRAAIVTCPSSRQILDISRYFEQILQSAPTTMRIAPAILQQEIVEILMDKVQYLVDQFKQNECRLLGDRTSAADILLRAESFFVENEPEDITIQSLCEGLAINQLTLRNAFAELLSMTPREWLIARKLDIGHRLLSGGTITTTQLALASGFGHLGRFSTYYRKIYGDLPSTKRVERLRAY